MKEASTKIDINKVIIGGLIVIILLAVSFAVYSINSYNSHTKTYSRVNEYASNNNKENISNDSNKTLKEENIGNKEDIVDNDDQEIISYFEVTENEVDNYLDEDDTKLSSIVKDKFTTLVDFIFYGTEINGITFNELSENTKAKLIAIVEKLDTKIEEKIPGYKETIKSETSITYTFLIDKLKQGITYVDEKASTAIGEDKYTQMKDDVHNVTEKVKDGASKIVDKTKEIASSTKEKIKNWYEGWK